MPPKITKETVIFVTNIGIQDNCPNGKIYFNNAQEVMTLIIKKKIFLRPKDEIGIVLMGPDFAQNNLNLEDIEVFQNIQVASWQVVKQVGELIASNCHVKSWINGLKVALDLSARENYTSTRTTFILLADYFESDELNGPEMRRVADSIVSQEFHVLCIGSKSLTTMEEQDLNSSEKMLLNFVHQTQGEYMTFENTLPALRIFGMKERRPTPWNTDLEISDIKIKTATYLLVKEEKAIPPWKKISHETNGNEDDDQVIAVKKKTELVDRHKNVIGREDVNEGYMFGREFVPVSEHDAPNLKLTNQVKSLILYGFTDKDLVKIDYRTGKQTYVLYPGENAEPEFFALAKAMADKKQVGIVRRVYSSSSAPKMSVLVPWVDKPDESWCMYMYELIFADEKNSIEPRPYRSILKRVTDEQHEAVGNLIDSMMLEEDEFLPGQVSDPGMQHTWNSIAARALNPNSPLPPVKDHLMKLITMTRDVEEVQGVMDKLVQLFPIPLEEKNENDPMDVEEEIQGVVDNVKSPVVADAAVADDDNPAQVAVDLDDLFDD